MTISKAFDPLLNCLILITKKYGRYVSPNTLTADLPIKSHLTPSLFPRAAKRAGFNAKLAKRALTDINPLTLPAVLVLEHDMACVLLEAHDNNTVTVHFAHEKETTTITKEKLASCYTGYCLLLKPEIETDQRAETKGKEDPSAWFWGTLWQLRKSYVPIGLAAFMINLFALTMPLFVMNVYDRVVPNHATATLWVLALGVLIVFGFDFGLRTLRGYLIDINGKKADALMASRLFSHLMNMKLLDKPNSAGAFANHFREYETLRDFFTSASLCALIDLPFIFLMLGVIAMIAGHLAWILVAAIPVVIIAAITVEVPLRKAIESNFACGTQKHAMLVETVNRIETIKSHNAQSASQNKWEHFVSKAGDSALMSRFFSSLAVNFSMFVQQLVSVIIVLAGVYQIINGHLSMGALIACTILSGRTLAPLSQIVSLLTRWQQARLSLTHLNHFMALPSERQNQTKFTHKETLQGKIDCEHVNFSYPESPIASLQNINFSIAPGEHVAILGPTGSGKSTLLRLLMGFYHADNGTVRIDNHIIDQLDPADLRSNLAYISQDSQLFYGSLRENITLAEPSANDEAIMQAAMIAGADQLIKRHPSGLDLVIGESGEGLSGGQRQAIALARAFLRKPPILLFDEPTSAMDSTLENKLIHNLKTFTQNKTVVMVTHKPSLLTLAHRIIVLDNGHIVADGTRDEILKKLTQNQNKPAEKRNIKAKEKA